jgi:putative sterol carrier protein
MTTTFVFPSLEWTQELANRLNALPEYRESGAGWKGTLALVALAEPGKLKEDEAYCLDPTGGVIKDVRKLPDAKNTNAEYTLIAKYSVWKDVIQGKYDILAGILRGKIRLKGSVFKLMLQMKTPEYVLREMRAMPTQFPS